MKYFLFFLGCCFWLGNVVAQNMLPYEVSSKDLKAQVKIYQTSRSKVWRAAGIKNEQVIWKIMDFPHNGDRNHSYVSSAGHIFVQATAEFTTPKDVVLRVWRHGELLWEYQYQDLYLPEDSAIQQINKKWSWFSSVDIKSDQYLEFYLQSSKKYQFSLITGLPVKLGFLDRFSSSGPESDFLAQLEQKSKVLNVQSLLGGAGLSDSYNDAMKKQVAPGILKTEFTTPSATQKIVWKDFYQEKNLKVYHPDTLGLLLLRFCSEYFTPIELKTVGRIEYAYDLENRYYSVKMLPKLPNSVKFQKMLNPKFDPELDKEQHCTHLRVTLDGKISGCFFIKE